MNKKLLMCVGAISIGVALLTTTVFAGTKTTKGYDSLKESLKKIETVNNATANFNAKVTDNGKVLVSSDGLIKFEKEPHQGSGKVNLTTENKTNTIEFWSNDTNTVLKVNNDDVYKIMDCKEKDQKMKHKSFKGDKKDKNSELGEAIFDTLMGDLKTKVTDEKVANNSTKYTLNLEGSQIPDTLRTILSLGIKNHENKDKKVEKCKILDLDTEFNNMPKLTSDVDVKNINISTVISSKNQPEKIQFSATFTGKDAAKKSHTINITASFELSQIDTTKVDTINLEGKKTEKIESCKED